MSRQAVANIASVVLLVLVVLRATGGGGVLPIPIPVPPSPKPGSWIVLVEPSEERSAAVARLLANQEWQDEIKSRQLKFRYYDDQQQEATSYRPLFESVGFPAVVVVDSTGVMLDKFRWDGDIESLNKRVKEATGL